MDFGTIFGPKIDKKTGSKIKSKIDTPKNRQKEGSKGLFRSPRNEQGGTSEVPGVPGGEKKRGKQPTGLEN